jgi:hypothetical protein
VQNVTQFRDKTKKSQTDFFLHDFNQLSATLTACRPHPNAIIVKFPGFVIATVIRKFTDAQPDSRGEK